MTQEELDRIYRKSRPTQEFNLELIRGTESFNSTLRAMGDDINGRLRELLSEIKEGEKVQSVQVIWRTILDRERNPELKTGHWMVLVGKMKPETT